MSDNVYITQEELEARADELLLITEATKALSQSSNELERAAVHTAAATAALTPPLEHLQANSESGARAAEAQAEGVKKAGDEAEDAADKVGKLSKANAYLKKAINAVERNVKPAMTAVYKTYGFAGDTIKAMVNEQREQLAIDARLRSSLESTGATAEEVAQRMSQANALFADAQSRTVFGDEAQAAALTNLINITGNTASAYATLGTALDAAQHSGSDLEKVSVAIGQAMTGDIKKLKEMNLLRKEEAEKLTRVEDASIRASIAMDIVRERTEGAAESIDPTLQKVAQLENDFGDARQALGGLALALLEGGAAVISLGSDLEEGASHLSTFANNLNTGTQALYNFFGDDEKRTKNMVDHFGFAFEQIGETANESVLDLVFKYTTPWQFIGDTMASYYADGQGLMTKAEAEEHERRAKARADREQGSREELESIWDGFAGLFVPDNVQRMMKDFVESPAPSDAQFKLNNTLNDQDARAAEERERIERERAADRARERRERAAEERKQSEQRIALMNLELEALQATTDEERENIELKRSIAEIKHRGLSDAEEELAIQVATAQMDEQREKRKKEAEEEAKTKQNAIDLANQELKILNTRDELQRASAERELALMRVAQQDMSDEERRLEYARIEIGYEETLAEIKDSERKKADEERAKAEEERKKARKALQEHFKYADKLGGSLAGAFDALGVSGIGETVDALSGMSDEFFTLRDAGKKSAVALEGSLTAGSAAAKGAMEALGLGVQETAGIQAAFEAAAAVAAGATGNIPGAIAHGVAATMYGAVAAGAGSGGGSSAGSSSSALSGGGSSSGGPIHTPDPQQLKEYQTQAYLEALREYDREGQQIVINVNNQGANFFERQTASTQRVASELERAAQLTIGGSALRG